MMYCRSWKVRVVALRGLHALLTLVCVFISAASISELAMSIESVCDFHQTKAGTISFPRVESVRAVIAGYAATSSKRRRHG